MTNNGRMSISEAYDSRVAYPLIIVAVLSLLFVDVNGHKVLPLKNTTTTSGHKKLVNHEASSTVNSTPALPTLSSDIKTEDLAPGQSPLDIQTASPQSSTSNESASTSSGKELQNTPDASSSSSNQPTVNETQNLIDGLTNDVINVQSSVTNSVKSILSH